MVSWVNVSVRLLSSVHVYTLIPHSPLGWEFWRLTCVQRQDVRNGTTTAMANLCLQSVLDLRRPNLVMYSTSNTYTCITQLVAVPAVCLFVFHWRVGGVLHGVQCIGIHEGLNWSSHIGLPQQNNLQVMYTVEHVNQIYLQQVCRAYSENWPLWVSNFPHNYVQYTSAHIWMHVLFYMQHTRVWLHKGATCKHQGLYTVCIFWGCGQAFMHISAQLYLQAGSRYGELWCAVCFKIVDAFG